MRIKAHSNKARYWFEIYSDGNLRPDQVDILRDSLENFILVIECTENALQGQPVSEEIPKDIQEAFREGIQKAIRNTIQEAIQEAIQRGIREAVLEEIQKAIQEAKDLVAEIRNKLG